MTGISNALTSLPFHAARTITFDRGIEFSAWPYLQAHLGVEVWFCDPQASWQKGTVENTNLRTRHWLPRDTDPTAHPGNAWAIEPLPKSSKKKSWECHDQELV